MALQCAFFFFLSLFSRTTWAQHAWVGLWSMQSHMDCWTWGPSSKWLLASYPSLRHHLCNRCFLLIWRNENGCTWSVLSGIFKNVRSTNGPLWPCEYWNDLSFLMCLICALKSCVLIIYFLNIISCWCPFFVIDWEDFSRQLYKKLLWMGGCAIWGGKHLQGGALHLSCVQPGYACCFCGWKPQALPF